MSWGIRVAGCRGWIVAALVLGSTAPVLAGDADQKSPLQAPAQKAMPEPVVRTVYVPQMVPVKQTVQVTVCRPEVRQRPVVVCRQVPEVQQVKRMCTVMVPETHTRTVPMQVCRPVYRDVEQQVTVCVPTPVKRTYFRTVTQRVPVQSTRVVCRDMGHWEERCCDCGSCCGSYKVWVPNMVRQEIPVTSYRCEYRKVPFEVTEYVPRQEVRTRKVRVCDYVYEKQERQVQHTVMVPKQVERTFNVTHYRTVQEKRMVSYTVMVPHVEEREVTTYRCQMVAKQVVVQPSCCF